VPRGDDLSVHLLGIRHHGPGSARSVARALERLEPDAVLVEGPPDADAAIPFVASDALRPPVALLVYAADRPGQSSFYPFAEFSPEWQALRYAVARAIPVRFMDLPLGLRYAAEREREEAERRSDANPSEDRPDDASASAESEATVSAESEATVSADEAIVSIDDDANESVDDSADAEPSPIERLRRDPLDAIAHASGFTDGEAWWDRMVERGDGSDVFDALAELMTQVRAEIGERDDVHELRREAAMRQMIRAAMREYETIAVVCGAWHVPALRAPLPPARADAELLRGARPVKISATWVPWSYGRLTFASGYGAGIESPGWYAHLWSEDPSLEAWMTKAARVYRERQLDISPAHAIEATRLAGALAALRGAPVAGLAEANDAMWSVICAGDAATFALARDALFVGERLGTVGEDVPQAPLLADVAREQKRLRLPPEAASRELELDLRKPNDRERSLLLQRLRAVGVGWGLERSSGRTSGTFRESWLLAWKPEFSVELVAGSTYGTTLEAAAEALVAERAARARELAELTTLLATAFAAALDGAIRFVLARIGELAARTHDAALLLDAIPPLAQLRRYGDVRGTESERVEATLEALVPRACIALPLAVLALDDDAAASYAERLVNVDGALRTLEVPAYLATWRDALAKIASNDRVHGAVAGRATRMRFDAGAIDFDEVRATFSRALSRGTPVSAGAAWIEGLLGGSGAVLVHKPALLDAIDGWLEALGADDFLETLPLVRRTFATFASGERRAIAERVMSRGASGGRSIARDEDFDPERIALVLPALHAILGPSR
jgi:hypothetical protein